MANRKTKKNEGEELRRGQRATETCISGQLLWIGGEGCRVSRTPPNFLGGGLV